MLCKLEKLPGKMKIERMHRLNGKIAQNLNEQICKNIFRVISSLALIQQGDAEPKKFTVAAREEMEHF